MFCSDILDDLPEDFAIQLVPQGPAAGNCVWVARDLGSQCFVLMYTCIYSHT